MTAINMTEPPALDRAEDLPARAVWVKPAYSKYAVRGAETANTNSNFDGTNYSS